MIDNARVRVLPPIIPFTAVVFGAAVHWLWPVGIGFPGVLMGVGIALIGASIVIVIAAVRELSAAKTAFDVRNPTTSLVTTGIYRVSRNPTYLSMMFLCYGIALIANSLPVFVFSTLAGSGLCLLVIRQEETYLQGKFGARYKVYLRSVRRWI